MASPRTKYKEHKRKMEEWSKLFEQEYGFAPTDDDRLESNTYNALLEKARHYRAHIAEGAVPRSPDRKSRGKSSRNASTPSGTRSKASRSDRHGGAQRNTSAPPMRAGRSSSNHRESRAGSSSHRSPSKRTESNGGLRASPAKSPSGRKGTRSLGVDVSALSEEQLSSPEYRALETKARDALEKLGKWERAFEREQGEPPTDADKAASSTYMSYDKKLQQYTSRLSALVGQYTAAPMPPRGPRVHASPRTWS